MYANYISKLYCAARCQLVYGPAPVGDHCFKALLITVVVV